MTSVSRPNRMMRLGRIGMYGKKTRNLQRRLTYEAFGLSAKHANFYKYLGSRVNDTPDIGDVQNPVFFEVPDRAYDDVMISVPIGMEHFREQKMDFSRFGLINAFQDETEFRMHIDDFELLGREVIVGDVFEIPFHTSEKGKSFWEVVDVDLRSAAEKFIAIIMCVPLGENRKTIEIPTDRGHGSIMDDIMDDMNSYVSKDVPAATVGWGEPDVEEVDYRTDKEVSFLDDINKKF